MKNVSLMRISLQNKIIIQSIYPRKQFGYWGATHEYVPVLFLE